MKRMGPCRGKSGEKRSEVVKAQLLRVRGFGIASCTRSVRLVANRMAGHRMLKELGGLGWVRKSGSDERGKRSIRCGYVWLTCRKGRERRKALRVLLYYRILGDVRLGGRRAKLIGLRRCRSGMVRIKLSREVSISDECWIQLNPGNAPNPRGGGNGIHGAPNRGGGENGGAPVVVVGNNDEEAREDEREFVRRLVGLRNDIVRLEENRARRHAASVVRPYTLSNILPQRLELERVIRERVVEAREVAAAAEREHGRE